MKVKVESATNAWGISHGNAPQHLEVTKPVVFGPGYKFQHTESFPTRFMLPGDGPAKDGAEYKKEQKARR
jgi:hypothetical protein